MGKTNLVGDCMTTIQALERAAPAGEQTTAVEGWKSVVSMITKGCFDTRQQVSAARMMFHK